MALSMSARKRISLSIFALILAAIAFGVYLLIQQKQNEFRTTTDPQKAHEVALSLKEKVGKIFVLPPEDPAVATIVDKNILPKNSFYEKAENGDKILVFSTSKKLILYRPSINKVVDVADFEPAEIPEAPSQSSLPVNSSSSGTFQTQPRIIFKPVNK